MKEISVSTNRKEELIDITRAVAKCIDEENFHDGICVIFTPHTTGAVTINENADPDVKSDMIHGLSSVGIEDVRYDHSEGNSPAHIKSSLVGVSETVIIENGRLILGTWQGIYFCEFDGPRKRKVYVKMIGNS
ncbi:MAG TPA: secondary thiamine-phosphate synthase enzyme YjbQ [Spirochaetota bacterium]|jgi:secondary thiamine-phosphate synthase enzyme|nr:secondary thiamine-phosphate synthase enzyme YjbQ [Spirochaetota bacterium]HQA53049.1 secondary thiamine-phosphate synthase enzyme YjbQ [Spirochaetota bacterium]